MTRHPYATRAYAEALASAEGSKPEDVPEWSTFVVGRSIDGGGGDVAGPYPRTPLLPGADLKGGLRRLAGEGFVSVVLVSDPMTGLDPTELALAFPLCRPFKTHLVVERPELAYAPSKHHRYEIRRAFGQCVVDRVSLADWLGDWWALYRGLINRHSIVGPATFSPGYFDALANDSTFVTFRATAPNSPKSVAMAIWFEHDGIAYNHLGASSAEGYALGASYGLYAAAIEHFGHVAAIDLGGGAGVVDDPHDGLARFKRGFANSSKTAMLCGAVLDATAYDRLAAGQTTNFFPAYRG